MHIACSADMRYVGQSYQLEVPVDLKSNLEDLERDFPRHLLPSLRIQPQRDDHRDGVSKSGRLGKIR